MYLHLHWRKHTSVLHDSDSINDGTRFGVYIEKIECFSVLANLFKYAYVIQEHL